MLEVREAEKNNVCANIACNASQMFGYESDSLA